MDEVRMAENHGGQRAWHVVRGGRYACGAKRVIVEGLKVERRQAHTVGLVNRCDRIGCANDFAEADKEALS